MEKTKLPVVNRKYKDSFFCMLYNNKKNLLELYNAVNGTGYNNPEDLEIVTLVNAIYMAMKNDVSCIVDMTLQLFEHQSTFNPNMPARVLMYVTEQIEKLMASKDIYSSKLIQIPTPNFFVFYNGLEKQPEKLELRLSDAFTVPVERPALEVIVTQYNINKGYNQWLMDKCPTLMGYMTFIDKVREYQYTDKVSLDEAVDIAIEECIAQDILRDFLIDNKAEVKSMLLYEFDEEKHNQTIKNEAYEDGFAEGEKLGYEAGEKSGYEAGEKTGYEAGEKSGYEAGEKTGKQVEKFQIARNMIEEHIGIDIIVKVTGLTKEEIKDIL